MGPKLAIIFNPVGGSAKNGDVGRLKKLLVDSGRDVSMLATTAEPGSAKKLALDALKQERALIMVGGDGTACLGAEALYEWEQLTRIRRQMAIVAGGTGNLFLNSLGPLPTLEGVVQLVHNGKSRPIDLIRLTYKDGRQRMSMVGVGLGKISDAISDANPAHKRRFGILTYVAGVTLACLNPSGANLELVMPDRTVIVPDALALFALNVTPNTMPAIGPNCDPSDGKLDVATFSGTKLTQVVRNATCLAFGRPEDSPHYQTFQTDEVTIRSRTPLRPNIDGDPFDAAEELNLKVLHKAVDVVL